MKKFLISLVMVVMLMLAVAPVSFGQGYSGTIGSAAWLNMLMVGATDTNALMNKVEDNYKKWYAFTYGMSDAQIAAALSISEAEAHDMQAAFNALHEMYGALTNAATSTADRKTILLKFQ